MASHKLDQEEQKILDAFDGGTLSPIENSAQEVERITHIFKIAGNKSKRVSFRMYDADYLRAKELALQQGMPYQTLLSSILHKYFTGRLKEVY